jgi:transcriptional regulator with GAF, ATPase, and Fis domain
MSRLCAYSWPGNIRELQNLVERAVVLTSGSMLRIEGGALLESQRLPAPTSIAVTPPIPTSPAVAAPSSGASLEEIERQHIISVLQQANWRIEGNGGAAKILDLEPSTLRSRMKKLGIVRRSA